MKIYIRADASVGLGSGHVMRCLTLADRLAANGAEIVFFCKKCIGDLSQMIMERGYRVIPLDHSLSVKEDAETVSNFISNLGKRPKWLIVDHYSLDINWEEIVRPFVEKIMVIDDLANRKHDCDIVLDQNYYIGFESRYDYIVPPACLKFLGPNYALLRPEFLDIRKQGLKRDGIIRRIFVFFGGTDPTNETSKALDALEGYLINGICADVVVGANNPLAIDIQNRCKDISGVRYYCQISNIAEIMNKADLAICAGGSNTWERCCLGLPSLVISVAENQKSIANACSEAGLCVYLGDQDTVTTKTIVYNCGLLMIDSARVKKMAEESFNFSTYNGTNSIVSFMYRMG